MQLPLIREQQGHHNNYVSTIFIRKLFVGIRLIILILLLKSNSDFLNPGPYK